MGVTGYRTRGEGTVRVFGMALFLAALLLLIPARGSRAEGWERFEQPYGGKLTSPYMWYWIYFPEKTEPGMPLVVYLHSTHGCSNQALTHEKFTGMINDGTIQDPQALILVPQLPGGFDDDWSMAIGSVNNIVERVIEEYQVDETRVALTGFSLGGVYVWDVAASTPGRYTRLMSLCGRVHYLRIHEEAFEGVEVRAYTARRDEAVSPATVINFMEKLEQAGVDATHVELELKHAEVPAAVYADREVQEWLWMQPAQDTGESEGTDGEGIGE